MGAVGRIILILIIMLLVAGGAGYFLVPPVASSSETVTVERPAPTVFARLASMPANMVVAEGVTLTEITSAEDNVVVGNVAYAFQARASAARTG